MRIIIFFGFVALIVVAVILVNVRKQEPEESEQASFIQEQDDPSFDQKIVDTLVVELAPLGDSGESGTAVMKKIGERITVTLDFAGVPEGVTRQAYIYTGSCESLNETVSTLFPAINGTSETILSRSPIEMRDIRIESGMSIVVHASEAGQDVVIACGEVTIPAL